MKFKRTNVVTEKNELHLYWGIKKIKFASLGNNVRVSNNCFFAHAENIYIEDDVFLAREIYIDAISEIYIGSGVMIGPRCTFIAGSHNYNSNDLKSIPYDNRMINLPIIIEKNVWIGANVSIAPGTHIEEGCVIGMGASIYGTIPKFSVVGAGAYKIIKTRDEKKYLELRDMDMIYNKVYSKQK